MAKNQIDQPDSAGSDSVRCIAMVGPYGSGKTTLLESLLHITQTNTRRGDVTQKTSFGDASPEARRHQMSTEPNFAAFNFLGDSWAVIDCPGSIEFAAEMQPALHVADAVLVVCEPEIERCLMLGPIFRQLEERALPYMVFINKMDHTNDSVGGRIRELMQALQSVAARPLILRQVPIRKSDQIVGYVDVVSERAYHYTAGQASDLIPLPTEMQEREQTARQELLETVADFDDSLMEQLIEDVIPEKALIYQDLAQELQNGLLASVFLGAGRHDYGVRRLLKALRHEVPGPEFTVARLGLTVDSGATCQIFRSAYHSHSGKLSAARLLTGSLNEGDTLGDQRVSGLMRLHGLMHEKITTVTTGSLIGLGRLETIETGQQFTGTVWQMRSDWPRPPPPVYRVAIHSEKRADEIKIGAALTKLIAEDASLSLEQRPETGEIVLAGQGGLHLDVTLERLKNRYHVTCTSQLPRIPYRESIRKTTRHHSRFKRQTGGHGQFADIEIEIAPLPRGEGFVFKNQVIGGAVPRNYIPAVEAGIREWMTEGPLGFSVVDFAVILVGGQFHAVDSSEMAFKIAARQAMSEAMPVCAPILLEPIHKVTLYNPNQFTAKVQRLISGRRGHLLNFDVYPHLADWDVIEAMMPLATLQDLILELRSVTQGIGSFVEEFDHLAELDQETGRTSNSVRNKSNKN